MGLASFPFAELTNIGIANVDTGVKAIAENADIAIGARLRMSKNVISRFQADSVTAVSPAEYVRRVALVMQNGLRRRLPAAARGLVLTGVQVAVEAWEVAGRNLQAHAMPR